MAENLFRRPRKLAATGRLKHFLPLQRVPRPSRLFRASRPVTTARLMRFLRIDRSQ